MKKEASLGLRRLKVPEGVILSSSFILFFLRVCAQQCFARPRAPAFRLRMWTRTASQPDDFFGEALLIIFLCAHVRSVAVKPRVERRTTISGRNVGIWELRE